MMSRIERELREIAELQRRIKERSMIYQCDAKEEAARKLGLPIDSFYDLPYTQWLDVQNAVD